MQIGIYALLMASAASVSMGVEAKAQSEQSPPIQEASQFDDIVVTARRVEESLQKVPLAVTALSTEDIEDRRISTVADLGRLIPSFGSQGSLTLETYVIVRGQGGRVPNGVSAVIEYANEVPLPGFSGGPGYYFDLESVQALSGVQGTLFGRNSTGGAILYQSKRPTSKWEGYVEAGIGNYGNRELNGVINIPIVPEKVLLRASYNFQKRDGYTVSDGAPEKPNGFGLDNRDVVGGRVTLRLNPTETIQNDTIFFGYRFKSNGDSSVLHALNPDFAGGIVQSVLQPYLDSQNSKGIRRTNFDNNYAPLYKQVLSITNITKIDLTNNLQLTNIASFTQNRIRNPFALDDSPFPHLDYLGSNIGTNRVKQITEEIQLSGQFSRFEFRLGAFYLKVPQGPYYSESALFFFGAAGSEFQSRSYESSKALFGQASYNILDNLKITGGIRYTRDARFGQSRVLAYGDPNNANGTCVLPIPDTDPNYVASDPCLATKGGRYDAWTGSASTEWQVTPDTLIYGAAREGYRPGGANVRTRLLSNGTFKPEKVSELELGAKTQFEIGTIASRLNVALYHQKLKDAQFYIAAKEPGFDNIPDFVKNLGESR